ncbi:hypothetical protein EVAR_52739_1 [Eumeta japonica]|uniref:Uncharacterized protein n=1 Tax=Eumeta variegata TaxID=151549 RepID=A0A4C1Y587_EUMVA|nr:hypothetical protein EVAR_52739_1 [Eumeta japonica]
MIAYVRKSKALGAFQVSPPTKLTLMNVVPPLKAFSESFSGTFLYHSFSISSLLPPSDSLFVPKRPERNSDSSGAASVHGQCLPILWWLESSFASR